MAILGIHVHEKKLGVYSQNDKLQKELGGKSSPIFFHQKKKRQLTSLPLPTS